MRTVLPCAGSSPSPTHATAQCFTEIEYWYRCGCPLSRPWNADPSLTSCNTNGPSFSVITDLGFAGKVDLAFKVFDDMRTTGLPLTVNTYNRLLGVCEKVRYGRA